MPLRNFAEFAAPLPVALLLLGISPGGSRRMAAPCLNVLVVDDDPAVREALTAAIGADYVKGGRRF